MPARAMDLALPPKPSPKPAGTNAGEDLWHTMPAAAVLAELDASIAGLTGAEADARLSTYGPNSLPERPPPTLLEIFARQFRSPLIYILAVAALISLAIGEYKDSAFIAAVLVLNAIIGTYQEARAESSSRALRKLLSVRASVLRDNEAVEIDAEAVVPGDVAWLESGDRVPADLRLLDVRGLEIDESLLTGESLPVEKSDTWTGTADTALADRRNMAFAGSMVAHGRGRGVVVATGAASAVGRLAVDLLRADAAKPPLVQRMERFSKRIAAAVLVSALLIAVLGTTLQQYGAGEMLLFSIALAVSAIPEGLPVALTVALAVGASRMAKRNVIIRRLAAVEGLGSCTLIASDKTGTLTCNALTCRVIVLADGRRFEVTGEGFAPDGLVCYHGKVADTVDHPQLDVLARAAVLCNEGELHRRDAAWRWSGDPTDVALLTLAHKLEWRREFTLENHPQVNSIPFEPEHRFAASYHRVDGDVLCVVKGAPERVLEMCGADADKAGIIKMAEQLAEQGYRVLLFAQGLAPAHLDARDVPPEPSELEPIGLIGMIDPLRPGVREAVETARSAGIRTIMVTGDHPVTALAIARELALADNPDQVVTGAQLAASDPSRLPEIVRRARVFARVAPHQKLEIVRAALEAGDFVAVTGDGVNDAPALRAANIGIAMGESGTDVAREAAELIITDDHFGTITAGIEEGRIAYDNVRNVIYLLVSTGFAEVVLVSLAIATGMPLPLLPAQLLWLNLVTNGIQDVALAFEPGQPDVLARRPRPPREPIFNKLMLERTVVAALWMGAAGFLLFRSLLDAGWSEPAARNVLLLLMVLFENVHVFNSRSETTSAFRIPPLRNPVLMVGVAVAFLIHLSMLYLPLGQYFIETEPVDLRTWMLLLGIALSILAVMELHKLLWRVRQRRRLPPASTA